MRAEDYLQSGDLGQALATLTEEIRSKPAKAELRVFMFQLLSVLGQWERAMTQLNVAAEMDSDALLMAQVYRLALNCEVLRSEIFQGKRSPLIFGEPLDWTAWLAQALPLMAGGELEAAAGLRDRAFEAAEAVSGHIDGQPFAWIADADTRLGPILEAVINGKYYWIPFQRIAGIQIEKPIHLRDVVWITATFTWTNQGQAVGLIPGRYSGSETEKESALQMGRKTEWKDVGNGFFTGVGQRMLATDQGDYPLLETREILLDQPEGEPRDG